jgi:hypothetical protein
VTLGFTVGLTVGGAVGLTVGGAVGFTLGLTVGGAVGFTDAVGVQSGWAVDAEEMPGVSRPSAVMPAAARAPVTTRFVVKSMGMLLWGV